jgi:hypothetical protein
MASGGGLMKGLETGILINLAFVLAMKFLGKGGGG